MRGQGSPSCAMTIFSSSSGTGEIEVAGRAAAKSWCCRRIWLRASARTFGSTYAAGLALASCQAGRIACSSTRKEMYHTALRGEDKDRPLRPIMAYQYLARLRCSSQTAVNMLLSTSLQHACINALNWPRGHQLAAAAATRDRPELDTALHNACLVAVPI